MEDTIDDSLRCPITLELFNDPVIGEDGHTYERKNITSWLQVHGTSPLTREPMSDTSLRPNHLVRKLVDEFLMASKEKQYQFRLNIDVRKSEQHPWFISFGKIIYKAEWINKRGPPIILLKIDGARACREASFYAQLSCHPHIVRTFGLIHNDPSSVLLVQEFTPYRDLSYQLREQEFRPSANVLLEIILQIIDALIYLADNGIVHGDVACHNVLAFCLHPTKPKHNLFKLTDFGLMRGSTVFSEVNSVAATTFTVKPVRYCAPEILRKKTGYLNYSEKSDVYSMGTLIWEAHSQGQLPFASIESDTEVKRIRRSGEVLQRPHSCNTALWSLVIACWNFDPNDRPSFRALKDGILEMRYESNQSNVCDLSISHSENVMCRLEDINLDDFDEYLENSKQNISPVQLNRKEHKSRTSESKVAELDVAYSNCFEHYPNRYLGNHKSQHKTDSNVFNTDSSLTSKKDLDRPNSDESSLTMVACSYCQEECSLDELDMHEEICRSNGIEIASTQNVQIPSASSRIAQLAKQQPEEQKKHHDVMSFANKKTTATNKLKPSKSAQTHKSSTIDPAVLQLFEMMVEDLDKFVFMTIPKELDCIECRVTREKGDVYLLHAERPPDKKKVFVLVGRKRRWNITSNYVITTDATDFLKDGSGIGSLRAKNFVGTEFTVSRQESHIQKHGTTDEHRIELAAVLYETNILGFKGPRKMHVILPKVHENNERLEFKQRNDSNSLLERWKRHDMEDLLELHNKPPQWNEETQSFVLNFHGRVAQPSVKNFQLVHDDEPDYVCLQFGRVSDNEFTCDYGYPLCAVQAFGIILSSFDNKLACE